MTKYRVSTFGFGCEIVYGTLTEDQLNFWTDANKLEEAGFDDSFSALNDYFWSREDYDDLVPESARIEDEWHDIDNLAHGYGPSTGGYLIVERLEDDGVTVAEEIHNFTISDLLNEKNHVVDEYEIDSKHSRVFFTASVEKGGYHDGIVEDDEFDVNKLKFNVSNYPNGDSLVEGLMYGDTDIDLNPDTSGKGLDMLIIEV